MESQTRAGRANKAAMVAKGRYRWHAKDAVSRILMRLDRVARGSRLSRIDKGNQSDSAWQGPGKLQSRQSMFWNKALVERSQAALTRGRLRDMTAVEAVGERRHDTSVKER